MKIIPKVFIILAALFLGFSANVQSSGSFSRTTNSAYAALHSPVFTNIPGAVSTISSILATPAPVQTMPQFSTHPASQSGTFFSLQLPLQPPLPGNIFSTLPVYTLSASNRVFLIDDRSVDYVALASLQAAIDATNEASGLVLHTRTQIINTNVLWLEVPTNALPGSNVFNVVIRHTTPGKFYDVLTKVDLRLLNWTVEQTVTATNDATPVNLTQAARTNLFVWARETAIPIYTQPLAQEVYSGDTVTFTVVADGSGLTYQWTFNGTNIYGATGSSYTIYNVSPDDAGEYACIITGANGSVTSQSASLQVNAWPFAQIGMRVVGQRQDYTFRRGLTYLIASPVQLTGETTIEGGTVIKFDTSQLYPCLQVWGTLVTKASLYDPVVMTSAEDSYIGIDCSYTGVLEPVYTSVPFLDLTAAGNVSLDNVHFRYAAAAVSTPYHARLDIWDSQFFDCDVAVLNEFGGTDSFHNVLFAGGYDIVAAFTNQFVFEAEHITADVTNVWESTVLPDRACVTNSIIFGSLGNAAVRSVSHTEFYPDPTNFQAAGAGSYYLADASAFHQSGTSNISTRLRAELGKRTTGAPLDFPARMPNAGNLTLSPHVSRYTNGAPDLGYYYDALDYTVAWLTNSGTITIDPGTVVGARNVPVPSSISTWWGFDLRDGSAFVSHGLPGRPNIFTCVQRVQEQNCFPSIALFLPDCRSRPPNTPPSMDFQFTDFYAGISWYHVWAGLDEWGRYLASYSSTVNWTMHDCAFHGGKISLGLPDSGDYRQLAQTNFYGSATVTWENNLFEDVLINVDPAYYWLDGTLNVDLAFAARNNLFRRNCQITLASIPASAGNWLLKDNLFDHAEFYQDPALPLDFDNNAYWPLKQPLYWYDTVQLASQANGAGGQHEVVLDYALPYANGAFGNYYLSTLTPLYEAGSRTAGDAGLAQYTTFINQAKDASNQPVNIGLHYVTTTNSQLSTLNPQPLDSDGDGVPDYVEAEHGTDIFNTMTDGITNDAYNAAYDDVDLSGNGLVGRIKKALGLNPLDPNNPLTLKQVGLDEDRGIVSFEVPISFATLTNIGSLNLNMNGIDVSLESFSRAANGNTLLKWNTLYDPPGQHYIQAEITLNGTGDDFAIISGKGKLAPYYSDNVVRFFESDAMFDETSAFMDAQLPVQDADYTIRLYDPATTPPTLMKTITNSTANGMIQEDWDLSVDGSASTFSGGAFTASFDVTLLDQPGGAPIAEKQQSKTLMRLVGRERTGGGGRDGFDFVYFKTPFNNSLASEFYHGMVWYGMQGVVDVLTMPNLGFDVYSSFFNTFGWPSIFSGYPGYVTSQATVTNFLYPDMANGTTKNFFGYGHGTAQSLGDYSGKVKINSWEVASLLGNSQTDDSLCPTNPYRFVFLDGCSTASKAYWRRAFGVMPIYATNQAARYILGPQAYVGWEKLKSDWLGYYHSSVGSDVAVAYTETLQRFYFDWMNGASLAQCIANSSDRTLVPCPLPVPEVKDFIIDNYVIPNTWQSKIFVTGHSGLTVSGLRSQDDHQYEAPK